MLKRARNLFLRIPPRIRYGLVVLWFAWKIVLVLSVLILIWSPNAFSGLNSTATKLESELAAELHYHANHHTTQTTRILYIVTTLAEYNTGSRATQKGQDRLGEVLLPILVDSVENILENPLYQVDVYLIMAYELKPEREQFIRDSLPGGVGLEVWDDACPLGYDKKLAKDRLVDNTRTLARQHRYVMKDKFFDYDLFMAWEDDMRVTADHIKHFLEMTDELDRLRLKAPKRAPKSEPAENIEDPTKTKFFGTMTRGQMDRLVPGFVRVEVLLDEKTNGAQKEVLPIPQDYDWDGVEYHTDAEICCSAENMHTDAKLPAHPKPTDMVIWETNVKAFALRQLPPGSTYLDWTVLMLGPGKKMDKKDLVGGYWSGRKGAFGDEKKPSGGAPDLIAQQGGWMATRGQIARMNAGLCMGSFLPPFDGPTYLDDGQQSMNVEFWSGSYQFFTGVRGGCNMQRLISLDPDHFSKHLICESMLLLNFPLFCPLSLGMIRHS